MGSMTRRSVPILFLAVATALLGCAGGAPEFVESASFDEAIATAAARDGLALVDFYATWCGPCKRFAADLAEQDTLRAAIAPAAFVRVDAESEDGGEALAERYGVDGYPTFVVVDGAGNEIDRWSGYGDATGFAERIGSTLADPITREARAERFAASPTVTDAVRLAEAAESRGEFSEAVRYLRAAIDLEPGNRPSYLAQILTSQVRGLKKETFATADVAATADELAGDAQAAPYDLANGARMLAAYADRYDLDDALRALLPRAIEATATPDGGDADDDLVRMHGELRVVQALRIDGDKDAAVAIKRETMPDGWMDDPQALNAFAWWCFENEVAVDEAIELARRGVELAEPGPDRAMILDTVAELCNLAGNCGEALTWIERALVDDPDNDHYASQKERFEALVAESAKTTTSVL